MCLNPGLQPWEGDGIDVGFSFAGTDWKLDVALRDTLGGLIVVECKRTADAVKQGRHVGVGSEGGPAAAESPNPGCGAADGHT